MSADLTDIQREAAELQRCIDNARTEQAARAAADKLHKLLDSVENVRVLRGGK